MNHHYIEYREEVLRPFFECIKSGESLYIVGAPSAGKTRLLNFLWGDDPDAFREGILPDRARVKKRYMDAEIVDRTLLVTVDMNRLCTDGGLEFNFFELLLSSVLLTLYTCESSADVEALKEELAGLDSQVIESRDTLTAYRFFELAVHKLCHTHNFRLCFLFDEFDETCKILTHEIFAHLRAVRDLNKYLVCYALFVRNLPDKLLDPIKNESFYELISRNAIGLPPFTRKDAFHMMEQLENRHEITLTEDQREWLYSLSGGHSGYIQALMKSLKESHQKSFTQMPSLDWYTKQEFTWEESRKIWIGLLEEEQHWLLDFTRGQTELPAEVRKLLLTKGIVVEKPDKSIRVFSPLFAYWLSKQ
jgi:hypothetical protein